MHIVHARQNMFGLRSVTDATNCEAIRVPYDLRNGRLIVVQRRRSHQDKTLAHILARTARLVVMLIVVVPRNLV